jgi:hypothetical protein
MISRLRVYMTQPRREGHKSRETWLRRSFSCLVGSCVLARSSMFERLNTFAMHNISRISHHTALTDHSLLDLLLVCGLWCSLIVPRYTVRK